MIYVVWRAAFDTAITNFSRRFRVESEPLSLRRVASNEEAGSGPYRAAFPTKDESNVWTCDDSDDGNGIHPRDSRLEIQ